MPSGAFRILPGSRGGTCTRFLPLCRRAPRSSASRPFSLAGPLGIEPSSPGFQPGAMTTPAQAPLHRFSIFDLRFSIGTGPRGAIENRKSKIENLKCPGVSYGSRTRSSRLTISRAHPAHSGHHKLYSLVGRGGVEPPPAVHQTAMQSATSPSDRLSHLVGMAGFEPAPSWFQARRSAQTELHPVNYSFLLLRAPESRTRPACL